VSIYPVSSIVIHITIQGEEPNLCSSFVRNVLLQSRLGLVVYSS